MTASWTKQFWFALIVAGFVALFIAPVAMASPDLSKGLAAFEQRRWIDAMGEFIQALRQDPRDAQAKAYLTLIARQLESERQALSRDAQLRLLEQSARHLEQNRQDSSPLESAIQDLTQAEPRAKAERWHLRCEEARVKRELHQLPAANDLIFQVLAENPSHAEAQRELSELQTALRDVLDHGALPVTERFNSEGFYAFGQADYEAALTAWQKVRVILGASLSSELPARLEALRFVPWEKEALSHVQEQHRLAELRSLFNQGTELYRNGRFAESLQLLRRLAIQQPDFPELGFYLVQAEAGADKERSRRLGEEKRRQIEDLYQAAVRALVQGQYRDAIEGFEHVLRLDPAHPQAASYLTMAKSERQKRSDPQAAQTRYESGLIAYASGKLDDAMQEWRMTLRLDPDHEKAKIALAKVQKELALSQTLP